MEIKIVSTGKNPDYDYHHEYVLDGKAVGRSDWDKNQSLYVASLDGYKKNIYHKSVEEIAKKMKEILMSSPYQLR